MAPPVNCDQLIDRNKLTSLKHDTVFCQKFADICLTHNIMTVFLARLIAVESCRIRQLNYKAQTTKTADMKQ